MSKNKKKQWGVYLQPHVATAPPRPLRITRLEIRPPSHWPLDKQRLFGMIEESLLRMKQFKNLSVMPPGCLYALVDVPHDIRGLRTA